MINVGKMKIAIADKLFKVPDKYSWECWLVGRRKEVASKTGWILRFVEKISGLNDPLTLVGFIFWVLLIVFNLVLGHHEL